MTASRTAIEQILGVPPNCDPFTLLGLAPGSVNDSAIVGALGRRMAAVAAHPMSESAEGNEVRLALHAAAAQLLDPSVRDAILRRLGVSAAPTQADAPPPEPDTDPTAMIGPQALLVIASEGGWNDRALRRLASLAHASGISSENIPEVIRSLVIQPEAQPNAPAPPGAPRTGAAPRALDLPGHPKTLGATAAAVVFACLAMAALTATWMKLGAIAESSVQQEESVRSDLAGSTQPLIEQPPGGSQDQPPDDSPRSVPPSAQDQPDWAAAAIAMRDEPAPPDADVLITVAEGIGTTWIRTDPARRTFIDGTIVELVHRLDADGARRFVGRLAELARGGAVPEAAWATGMLARLSRETSLGQPIDNAVLAGLAGAVGPRVRQTTPDFGSGVGQWLRARAAGWSETQPERTETEAWGRVLAALEDIDSAQSGAAARDALTQILRSPGAAAADRDRLIRSLVGRIGLPQDRAGVGLVLDLLGDPSVPPAGLAGVVAVLRSDPANAAIAAELDLSPGATGGERAAVRSVLESFWLAEPERSWAHDEYDRLLAAHLAQPLPEELIGFLADAVVSSRLSAAGNALLWGNRTQAESLLGSLRDEVDALLAAAPGDQQTIGTGARGWALGYLEAKRNIPVRQSLLRELVQSRPSLGPVAAEVLLTEAALGTPVQVRRQAQEAVPLFADQPEMVNAVLELLPRLPRVASTQRLVELVSGTRLPAVDTESWPFEARRAVVQRLLGMVAGENDGRAIDLLVELLADSYADRAGGSAGRSGTAADDLVRMIDRVRGDWIEELRRIDRTGTADAVIRDADRLLRGRLHLAAGPMTRFAAYQVSAFEIAAAVVLAERPEDASRIAQLLRTTAASRDAASSALHQIAAVERAFAELTAVRSGGGDT